MRGVDEGDIVQIEPKSDPVFGGCFMLVTASKPWGCEGDIYAPNGGMFPYRAELGQVINIFKRVN